MSTPPVGRADVCVASCSRYVPQRCPASAPDPTTRLETTPRHDQSFKNTEKSVLCPSYSFSPCFSFALPFLLLFFALLLHFSCFFFLLFLFFFLLLFLFGLLLSVIPHRPLLTSTQNFLPQRPPNRGGISVSHPLFSVLPYCSTTFYADPRPDGTSQVAFRDGQRRRGTIPTLFHAEEISAQLYVSCV